MIRSIACVRAAGGKIRRPQKGFCFLGVNLIAPPPSFPLWCEIVKYSKVCFFRLIDGSNFDHYLKIDLVEGYVYADIAYGFVRFEIMYFNG